MAIIFYLKEVYIQEKVVYIYSNFIGTRCGDYNCAPIFYNLRIAIVIHYFILLYQEVKHFCVVGRGCFVYHSCVMTNAGISLSRM